MQKKIGKERNNFVHYSQLEGSDERIVMSSRTQTKKIDLRNDPTSGRARRRYFSSLRQIIKTLLRQWVVVDSSLFLF